MAPCPYMIKTFENLLGNQMADDLETWYMQFWWLGGPIRFLQMMTLNWPWPIIQLGQIQSLRLIYWKKGKLEFVHGIWVIWPRWLSYPYMANRLEILHLSGFWMATFRIYWKPKLLDWLNYLKLFTKSILIHAKGTLAWKLPYVTANKWNNTLSIAYFATKKKPQKTSCRYSWELFLYVFMEK